MTRAKHPLAPASMMVWTVNDPVIEQPEILEREFNDMRMAGFDGLAVWVRCSRYSWYDEPARAALRRIGELCRQHSMQYWLGADPRFVSHQITERCNGLEVVAFGDTTRANVFPNLVPVVDGSFSIRCETPPRHVHTLTDVAVEFHPVDIVRAYAVRGEAGTLSDDSVIDITHSANFYYHARDRYVEAFGRFEPPDAGAWNVLAFFRFRTNHVDFSSRAHMRKYAGMLDRLKDDRIEIDGLMWDEPGFTCTYGTVPYAKGMRKLFKNRTGSSLKANLWKLAFDAADGSHINVRNTYYRIVQDELNAAQRKSNKHARDLWGKDLVAGIHDTWHFESADMCDMNHGSLDLWEALSSKSGGFVDIGGINDLRDPGSGYYRNLAAMNVIAASLGRWSEQRFAMNNLWTIGDDDGEGWQRTVMDHCVDSMALFGTRWMAHAYGPVGTIGEERTFLGSPPLPGYPDHSTWDSYPEWNARLAEHLALVENALPAADVLVVFPVETLYALADERADDVARQTFDLVLQLLDAHYQVEVLSSSLISDGDVQGYGAVICPHPEVVSSAMMRLLRRQGANLLFVFGEPKKDEHNEPVSMSEFPVASGGSDVVDWLAAQDLSHRIDAPASAWASVTDVEFGSIVTLAPARHGLAYSGTVRFGEQSVELQEQTGLTRILFPYAGTPVVKTVTNQTISR